MLLALAPHLVIDGMVAAAVAVGADCGVLCVGRRDGRTLTAVRAALAERRGADPVDLDVAAVPSRYVAGEETALVAWLNGGDARPTFSLDRPAQRGVDGRPTLVDNVETLAHVGVVALAGARPAAGTTLVTVRDGDRPPAVQEVEVGTPLSAVLAPTGGAVLVGGYFGTWLTAAEAAAARMSSESLAAVGASPGCGLVAAMPAGHCPLQEVAAVTWWLAANSAGQCGPCVNGLPAIARAVAALATGTGTPGERGDLDRWLAVTAGRGTCKLPDGAGRFVASAMRACAGHVEHHRRYGPCPPNHRQLLPTPALDGWR
jgi:NADH:ubiquinone oxidoreductase subunit F (NADH-binding)